MKQKEKGRLAAVEGKRKKNRASRNASGKRRRLFIFFDFPI